MRDSFCLCGKIVLLGMYLVVFYRYAFLQYSNSQQATNVVENSAEYRINGQPLHVSFYITKRSLPSTM